MGRRKTKKRANKTAKADIKSANPKTAPVKLTFRKNHFQCFVCQDQDLSLSEYQMVIHKSLKISMCDSCTANHTENDEWHTSKEWQLRDENDKSVYCEICGEGGTLIGCDEKTCSNSFCMECMKNWVGQEKLDKFLEDESIEFVCFCCFGKTLDEETKEEDSKEEETKEDESKDDESKEDEENDESEKETKEKDEGTIYDLYKRYLKATVKYQGDKEELDEMENDEKLIDGFNRKARIKQFKCYSCSELHDMDKKNLPQLHKDLKVSMCDSCYDYVDLDTEENKKNWTFTDGKSDYCIITGEGGDIIECEEKDCKGSYTTTILKSWLGHRVLNKYLKNDNLQFKCFLCNPELGKCEKFQKQSAQALNAFQSEDGDYIFDEPKKPVKKPKKIESTRKRSRGRKRKKDSDSESDSEPEESTRVTRKPKEKSSYFIKSESDSSGESDYAAKEDKKEEDPPTKDEIKKYYKYMINTRCNKRFKDNEIFDKLLKILK